MTVQSYTANKGFNNIMLKIMRRKDSLGLADSGSLIRFFEGPLVLAGVATDDAARLRDTGISSTQADLASVFAFREGP